MIKIKENIIINSKELKFRSIKSSGPGGQNINKNSTAVTLSFDILNSRSLSNETKNKILNKPHKYLSKYGTLMIKVNSFKSQKKNKSEAISRLISYIDNSTILKKKRMQTSPKKSAIERRLMDKKKNSIKKHLRRKPNNEQY